MPANILNLPEYNAMSYGLAPAFEREKNYGADISTLARLRSKKRAKSASLLNSASPLATHQTASESHTEAVHSASQGCAL